MYMIACSLQVVPTRYLQLRMYFMCHQDLMSNAISVAYLQVVPSRYLHLRIYLMCHQDLMSNAISTCTFRRDPPRVGTLTASNITKDQVDFLEGSRFLVRLCHRHIMMRPAP